MGQCVEIATPLAPRSVYIPLPIVVHVMAYGGGMLTV